jgi:hypothetical protein
MIATEARGFRGQSESSAGWPSAKPIEVNLSVCVAKLSPP